MGWKEVLLMDALAIAALTALLTIIFQAVLTFILICVWLSNKDSS